MYDAAKAKAIKTVRDMLWPSGAPLPTRRKLVAINEIDLLLLELCGCPPEEIIKIRREESA